MVHINLIVRPLLLHSGFTYELRVRTRAFSSIYSLTSVSVTDHNSDSIGKVCPCELKLTSNIDRCPIA